MPIRITVLDRRPPAVFRITQEADLRSLRLEATLRQYCLLSEDIRALMSSNDRLMVLSFTILGGGYSLGVTQKAPEVLIFLPFAAFALIYYGIFVYTSIFAMGSYRGVLEEQMTRLVGAEVASWETRAVKHLYAPVPIVLMCLIYFIFSIVISLYALVTVDSVVPWPVQWIPVSNFYLVALITFYVFLAYSILAMGSVGRRVRNSADLSVEIHETGESAIAQESAAPIAPQLAV